MKDDLLHGGALDRMRKAFPAAPEPWIDLSTGINPWPYPVGDIPHQAFEHLPTQAAHLACRDAMAETIGARRDKLVLAPWQRAPDPPLAYHHQPRARRHPLPHLW